jgi:hypothetical protein
MTVGPDSLCCRFARVLQARFAGGKPLRTESKVLVEKAVSMARPYNAKVSLIHVDVNYSDLYTGSVTPSISCR